MTAAIKKVVSNNRSSKVGSAMNYNHGIRQAEEGVNNMRGHHSDFEHGVLEFNNCGHKIHKFGSTHTKQTFLGNVETN